MEHICAAMKIITEDWKLRGNEQELVIYVHGLQGFIVQHMLQRIGGAWGEWYADETDGK